MFFATHVHTLCSHSLDFCLISNHSQLSVCSLLMNIPCDMIVFVFVSVFLIMYLRIHNFNFAFVKNETILIGRLLCRVSLYIAILQPWGFRRAKSTT